MKTSPRCARTSNGRVPRSRRSATASPRSRSSAPRGRLPTRRLCPSCRPISASSVRRWPSSMAASPNSPARPRRAARGPTRHCCCRSASSARRCKAPGPSPPSAPPRRRSPASGPTSRCACRRGSRRGGRRGGDAARPFHAGGAGLARRGTPPARRPGGARPGDGTGDGAARRRSAAHSADACRVNACAGDETLMGRLPALIAIAILIAIAVLIADQPGRVSILWQGWRIETSAAVLIVATLALALAAAIVFGLLRRLIGGPSAFLRARRERRRRDGYRALTQGMVAVAAGDAEEAQKFARKADVLLAEPPLPLLLSAQGAQPNGDDRAAQRYFLAMITRSETESLGLRGP